MTDRDLYWVETLHFIDEDYAGALANFTDIDRAILGRRKRVKDCRLSFAAATDVGRGRPRIRANPGHMHEGF